MANLEIWNPPAFTKEIYQVEREEFITAELENEIKKKLLNNDIFLKNVVDKITEQIRTKVDKEEGKGLSSNDYTIEEKEKVEVAVEEIRYIKEEIEDTKKSVRDGKTKVAAAITQKKVPTAATATFSEFADNINKIPLGSGDAVENQVLLGITFSNKTGVTLTGTMPNQGAKNQSLNAGASYMIPEGYHNGNGKVSANTLASQTSATAIAGQILNGQTAWVNGIKLTGSIPSKTAQTYIPSTTDQTIPSGQYLSGTQTIQGSANLIPENIRNGINLFGVTGILGGINFKKTTYLSGAKYQLTGGNIGDYVIFAGGLLSNSADAYNKELTHIEVPSLSANKNAPASAQVGNYLLIAGGQLSKTVEAYDNELTKTMAPELTYGKQMLAGGNIGNYAVFGAGYSSDFCSDVEAYDKQLIKTIIAPLSEKRNALTCASCGNKKYLLFVGGYTTGKTSNKVDIYDKNLVHVSTLELSESTHMLASASIGKYTIFAGGSPISLALAFDESLVQIKLEKLSKARGELAGTGLGEELAVFAGGYDGRNTCDNVDIYDSHLCKKATNKQLSVARRRLAAATVGNYVFFAGGYNNSGNYSNVDIYEKIT